MIGTRLGPYEVTAKLGEGGMGLVFKARDFHLGREVALKVLPEAFTSDPERAARFEREAKLLAQLNHPNIAQIYGFEASGDTRALVMEFVEGPTLAERLEQGPLPFNESLSISLQIAQALEEAHEKGIVHRDLKPQNVKASVEGKVKVLDFGLAKAMDPTAGSAASAADLARSPTLMQSPTLTAAHGTQLGVILGTAAYMAPEQARGVAVDKRADIWAFGVVLYEMLTGRRLFEGELVTDVLANVLKKEVDFGALPAGTPAAIRRLLRRCLERNPKNRLHDIADARIVLEELTAGRSDEAGPGPAGPPLAPGRRAAGLAATAAAVALVLGWAAGRFGWVGDGAAAPVGAASAVSYERLSFLPGNFVSARFAPDGQTAFLAADWRGQLREIFQVRPRAGELPIGVAGVELMAVSRSGNLAVLLPRVSTGNPYNVRGTLAVVSASGGTPRELAEDVTSADWLPDGESLAALRTTESGVQLEFPLGSIVHRPPSAATRLRVSPAGDAVAFFERGASGGFSVSVVDRSGRHQVWSHGWLDWWNLAWSPDGREIWFSASKSGLAANVYAVDAHGALRTLLSAPGTLELHDVAVDGGALVARVEFRNSTLGNQTSEPGAERDLSWLEQSWAADLTADGARVLLGVESEREPGKSVVFLRATDGSPPLRLGYGSPQELSRDGRWALATRAGTLVAMPTGSGTERTLETGYAQILQARWLPDGEQVLVFARGTDGRAAASLVRFGGGASRSLPDAPESRPAGGYSRLASPISPDGRLVAVATFGGVALLPLDGGAPRPLAGAESSEVPIQWSEDGRRLILFDPSRLPARLTELELESGRRRLVAEVAPSDLRGVPGITNALISADLAQRVFSFQRFQSDLYLVKGLQ